MTVDEVIREAQRLKTQLEAELAAHKTAASRARMRRR